MKIKLAVLERDPGYLNRLVTAFSTKYADKFEIYSFTDLSGALRTLETSKIEVFIASDFFEIDVTKLPKRCGFAYFVDSIDIDTINGQHAICKFQKADLIYKQILSVYSENAGNVSGLKFDNESTKIVVFEAPCGGVGASTLAAAYAIYLASKGKKTLYLNFEKVGSSEYFFSAEGQFDMSDVIYALKSKKANLSMKLESCVKQADNGVYFYSPAKVALDMIEFTAADGIRLLSELRVVNNYDYIVVDTDFSMNKDDLNLCRQAHTVVWVSDGSEIANTKLFRAYNALSIREQNEESPLTNRLVLIYNKFDSMRGKALDGIGLKNVGGAQKYDSFSTAQILGRLSQLEMFAQIM